MKKITILAFIAMNKLFRVFTKIPTYFVASDQEEAIDLAYKAGRWRKVKPTKVVDYTTKYYINDDRFNYRRYSTELLPLLKSGLKGVAAHHYTNFEGRWAVANPRNFASPLDVKPPGANAMCTHCGYVFSTVAVNNKSVCEYCREL